MYVMAMIINRKKNNGCISTKPSVKEYRGYRTQGLDKKATLRGNKTTFTQHLMKYSIKNHNKDNMKGQTAEGVVRP